MAHRTAVPAPPRGCRLRLAPLLLILLVLVQPASAATAGGRSPPAPPPPLTDVRLQLGPGVYNPSLVVYQGAAWAVARATRLAWDSTGLKWIVNTALLCQLDTATWATISCSPFDPWRGSYGAACRWGSAAWRVPWEAAGVDDTRLFVWPGHGLWALTGRRPQRSSPDRPYCPQVIWRQWLVQLAPEGAALNASRFNVTHDSAASLGIPGVTWATSSNKQPARANSSSAAGPAPRLLLSALSSPSSSSSSRLPLQQDGLSDPSGLVEQQQQQQPQQHSRRHHRRKKAAEPAGAADAGSVVQQAGGGAAHEGGLQQLQQQQRRQRRMMRRRRRRRHRRGSAAGAAAAAVVGGGAGGGSGSALPQPAPRQQQQPLLGPSLPPAAAAAAAARSTPPQQPLAASQQGGSSTATSAPTTAASWAGLWGAPPLPLVLANAAASYGRGYAVVEKNWMPFVHEGQLFVSHSLAPAHRVYALSPDGTATPRYATNTSRVFAPLGPAAAAKMHGGPPLVLLQPSSSSSSSAQPPYFLGVAHYWLPASGEGGSGRVYRHHLIRVAAQPPFEVLQVSAELPLRFNAHYKRVAFVSGLDVVYDALPVQQQKRPAAPSTAATAARRLLAAWQRGSVGGSTRRVAAATTGGGAAAAAAEADYQEFSFQQPPLSAGAADAPGDSDGSGDDTQGFTWAVQAGAAAAATPQVAASPTAAASVPASGTAASGVAAGLQAAGQQEAGSVVPSPPPPPPADTAGDGMQAEEEVEAAADADEFTWQVGRPGGSPALDATNAPFSWSVPAAAGSSSVQPLQPKQQAGGAQNQASTTGPRVLVSYGSGDSESRLLVLSLGQVERLFAAAPWAAAQRGAGSGASDAA